MDIRWRTIHRRRATCLLLTGLAAIGMTGVHAAPKVRIGFVSGGDRAAAMSFVDSFLADLAERGYDRTSIDLEMRFADDVLDRVPGLVIDLEHRNLAIIVTHAAATSIVVKGPHRVPVVYEFSADPATIGIASDLAHPLFNATGVTLMLAEVNGKRLELLKQILPSTRKVAVLANALHPGHELERAVSEAKARQLGIEVAIFTTRNESELDRALSELGSNPPEGMLVFSDGFVVAHRQKIIQFAMNQRLPVVSGWAVMAESGALFTYGPRLVDSYRRVGYFVDRIARGAKPSELPIEQPTVLELIINAKTARRLGLTIPQDVLARADRVIE